MGWLVGMEQGLDATSRSHYKPTQGLETAAPPDLAWSAEGPDALDALAHAGLRAAPDLLDDADGVLVREVRRRLALRDLERRLGPEAAAMQRDVDAWWQQPQQPQQPPWRAWLRQAVVRLGCRHCVDDPPAPCCCRRCRSPMEDDPVGNDSSCSTHRSGVGAGRSVLYREREAHLVTVFRCRCTNPACKTALAYDGKAQGVFNHTGASLYHEDGLRDFFDTFHIQHDKTTHATYEEMVAKYARRGGPIPPPSRDAFS